MSVGESQVCTSGGAPAVLYKSAATHIFTLFFFVSSLIVLVSQPFDESLTGKDRFLILHLSPKLPYKHCVGCSAASQAVPDVVRRPLDLVLGAVCWIHVWSISSVTRKHSAAFTAHRKTDLLVPAVASLRSSSPPSPIALLICQLVFPHRCLWLDVKLTSFTSSAFRFELLGECVLWRAVQSDGREVNVCTL